MNHARRQFLKTGAAAALGFAAEPWKLLALPPLLPSTPQPSSPQGGIHTGVFPFYKYADRYSIFEYIPMDQGGRFIQLELIGSERDEDIVKAIRAPGFFSPWGDPSRPDSLEKQEPEKCTWLNRLYYLPPFARSYYLTKDKPCLQQMLDLMRQWRDANPAPIDAAAYFATKHYTWRDMQVSWRVQNLCWCYFLTESGLTPGEKRELFELMNTHSRILFDYFGNQPLIENNHQSHGATAMLYAALLFPDVDNAAAMKASAFKILNHHLDKAFYDDGNSVELVPGYYPFFVSIFRDAYLLCRANNVPPPERCEERLRQFYDFMGTVKQPDERMPPINDSSESSTAVPLQVQAELLGLPFPYPPAESHWFKTSHQAVMRDADSEQPACVFLDAGPQIAAHWHGGKLGFHLWFWDKAFIIDSGVCDYDDPLKKSWYMNPEAHNTLLVDGKGDCYPAEAHRTKLTMAGSRIDQWESNETHDWAVMRHTGFENRTDPVIWIRHFILLKGVAALVVDQLESRTEHDYTWPFHFLPCSPNIDKQKKSVFTGFQEKNLLLQPADPQLLDGFELGDGTINKQSKNLKAPIAYYHRYGSSITQTFVLKPVMVESQPEVRIQQVIKGNTVVVEILGKSGAEQLTLNRDGDAETGEYSLHYKHLDRFEG